MQMARRGMTLETEGWGDARPVVAVPAPEFDHIIEMHSRTARSYRQAVWLLLALGLALTSVGLTGGGVTWLIAPGIVSTLCSLFAWKKSREHAERGEGVAVLAEEWTEIRSDSEAQRLHSLILDIYGAPSARQIEPATEPT